MEIIPSHNLNELFNNFISMYDTNKDSHLNLTENVNSVSSEKDTLDSNNSDNVNSDNSSEHVDIPDLITPELTPRKEVDVTCNNCDCNNTNCNNEQENNIKYSNILNDNQLNFIFKSTNTLLTLLILNELFVLLNGFTRSSFTVFLLNVLMFLFYNSNKYMLVNEQNNFIKNFTKYFKRSKIFVFTKFQELTHCIMNYFFSKNTQMMLKIVYNIIVMKIISSYETYRNRVFNPNLLVTTNKEFVYSVPFYLNGEHYKIPIIVSRYNTENKKPLMVLNKNEEDITKEILQYMGPNYDFYGMSIKPKQLNQENLNFMLEDGSEMNIFENDMMVF
jgi:hypothetical protein